MSGCLLLCTLAFPAFGQLHLSASYDVGLLADTTQWRSGFGGTVGLGGKLDDRLTLMGNVGGLALSRKKNSNQMDAFAINVTGNVKGHLLAPEKAFQLFLEAKIGAGVWMISDYPVATTTYNIDGSANTTIVNKDLTNTGLLTGILFGFGYQFSNSFTLELLGEKTGVLFFGGDTLWPSEYAVVSLRGVVKL